MTDKPKRPAMTRKRRLMLWERDGGVCYICGLKVMAGEDWDIEHVKCWEVYRDDSDENLRVVHRKGCHTAKTKADAAFIAKAKSMGLETGQQARRRKNGPSLKGGGKLQSAGFPKGVKTKWPKRKMGH